MTICRKIGTQAQIIEGVIEDMQIKRSDDHTAKNNKRHREMTELQAASMDLMQVHNPLKKLKDATLDNEL
eukprot:3509451-Prymnesium_polylepis.1